MQLWIDNLADLWGNMNLLAADLMERVWGLEEFGVRVTTLKFGALQAPGSGDASSRELEADERSSSSSSDYFGSEGRPEQHGWQHRRDHGAARLLDGVDGAARQRLVQPTQARGSSGSRRQLAASSSVLPGAARGSWRMAAQCWAFDVARLMGGEHAVLSLQRWIL